MPRATPRRVAAADRRRDGPHRHAVEQALCQWFSEKRREKLQTDLEEAGGAHAPADAHRDLRK